MIYCKVGFCRPLSTAKNYEVLYEITHMNARDRQKPPLPGGTQRKHVCCQKEWPGKLAKASIMPCMASERKKHHIIL